MAVKKAKSKKTGTESSDLLPKVIEEGSLLSEDDTNSNELVSNGTDDQTKLDTSYGSAKVPRLPKITYAQAFDLITIKGLSFREAAKIVGVRYQSLWEFCKNNNIPSKDALEKYKRNKANLLDAKGMLLLDSMTVDEIKEKTSPYQRAGMFGIFYDKARLERGESTQNVAYQDIGENLDEIENEIKQIQGVTVTNTDDEIDSEIARLEAEQAEEDLFEDEDPFA